MWPARAGAWASAAVALSPLLAILAIFCLLGLLLWFADKDERKTQREELIRDALWVEQVMQFQFTSERDRLVRFATDIGKGDVKPEQFAAQARQLMAINREIADIIWVDGDREVVVSMPIHADTSKLRPLLEAAEPLFRTAERGTFTAPFKRPSGSAAVAMVAPIATDRGDRQGSLVAVFSLDAMLGEHVPWWIAVRRAVHFADGFGNVLASRSRVAPDDTSPSYSVQIGPPMTNMSVAVVSYREQSNLAQNGLIGAMVAMGLFAAAGLWARERQIRRRRAAEEALDDEHAFRRALEDSTMVGVRARDIAGKLLYVNPAFCRMVGYSEAELIGLTPPMPYWAPEDLERTQRLHDEILAGKPAASGHEFIYVHRDGTRFDVLIIDEPLIDAQGRHRGWIGSVLDISDRKRAQEREREQAARLQHTARLVTMGEMATLLAHDLNQPLAAIQSYQTGLLNRLAGQGLAREDLEPALQAIGRSAEHAGRIIRRVHNFVKKSEPRLERITFADVVAETAELLEPELRKAHTHLEAALDPAAPLVRADRVLIEHVLVNLIRNALEAVALQPPERKRIRIEAGPREGRVEVRVRDWGPGVNEQVAQNLFSPFVSTKASGMGMGLSICRSIIEVHGGHIRYEPAGDGGAVFIFTLEEAAGGGDG